jgi:DNA-binding XRE family transcriptional regulator
MPNEHALTIWRNSQKQPLTQEALGERLGISRWWVNRLEKREATPSFELAIKIEELTGGKVTAKDFAGRAQ